MNLLARSDSDSWEHDEMAWVTPAYSKGAVDRAGMALIAEPFDDIDAYLAAFDVVNNWRSAHSFPLNTFTVTLRRKGHQVDANCLVAQRIKRLASITLKLRRFSGLRLSQIQDIGGCRAIVSDVEKVKQLVEVYRASELKHKMKIDDYIATPQASGYRGIHLIYTYNSDRSTIYNGQKIEMQIRSQFQHAWATAVETVGTFTRQALKSSQGEADWLRFFQLMGTAIALQEGSTPVDNTPIGTQDLRNELESYVNQLDLINKLQAFGNTLNFFETSPQAGAADYYLLILTPSEQKIEVEGFRRDQLQAAQAAYAKVEKDIAAKGDSDAVLVSVDSMSALRRAYPNYFLDTRVFIDLVREAIRGQPLTVSADAVS
jgi:hypothetical protein